MMSCAAVILHRGNRIVSNAFEWCMLSCAMPYNKRNIHGACTSIPYTQIHLI